MGKWIGCVCSTYCEDIYFILKFNAILKYKWVHGFFNLNFKNIRNIVLIVSALNMHALPAHYVLTTITIPLIPGGMKTLMMS
jgi:hypothetical protein